MRARSLPALLPSLGPPLWLRSRSALHHIPPGGIVTGVGNDRAVVPLNVSPPHSCRGFPRVRVSCVYATASRWGGPPVASEVRGDAAISTTPDAAPGLAARRRRILFVAEAVTLAHVVRPFALAQSLDPSRYEVHFACDPRYNQLLGPLHFPSPCDSHHPQRAVFRQSDSGSFLCHADAAEVR